MTLVRTPVLVDYRPDAKLTNLRIQQYNRLPDVMTPQEIASHMASELAAIAYTMLATNRMETVEELFRMRVREAQAQQDARKKTIADAQAKGPKLNG